MARQLHFDDEKISKVNFLTSGYQILVMISSFSKRSGAGETLLFSLNDYPLDSIQSLDFVVSRTLRLKPLDSKVSKIATLQLDSSFRRCRELWM